MTVYDILNREGTSVRQVEAASREEALAAFMALLDSPEATLAREDIGQVLREPTMRLGDGKWIAVPREEVSDGERLERIGALACDLLDALRPWEVHGAAVRSAAARLTVALAALPLPTEESAR